MVRRSIVYSSLLFMLRGDGIEALFGCSRGDVNYLRDGWCNDENNNESCAYDGGDCCPCTCTTGLTYDCESNGFFCRDPDSGCVDPGIEMYPNCTEGYIPDIENQHCDEKNNNENCGYDGGDCCECTRTDDGSSGSFWLCVDPSSPCYDPAAAALQSSCTDGYIPNIEDGQCNEENNNAECLYDGGDCCDCARTDNGSSSPFSLCVDPSDPCYDPVAVALKSNCPDGHIANIGNGQCNENNNNEGCLYDGGDCCECTRTDDGTSSSYSLCVDPSDPCYDPTAVALRSNCSEGNIANIEDGQCDEINNNEGCLYDGGDCCECTRTGNGSSPSFYLCVDPSAACFDPAVAALQSTCNHGSIGNIGDGSCDTENNNEECLYDGGDCCSCTCTHDTCLLVYGVSCVDPDVVDLERYVCMELPPTNTSCHAGLQHEWVVETPAQARELVKAVRCPGESFNVWWKAEIVMDETIYIADGTVLNVTNGGANSAIIGDGQTRLFTVVNASLYLENITISNGNAINGGAIAAVRSSLTFERVTFDSNTAIMGGGALSLSNGTIAVFRKEAVLFNNTAREGGAMDVMSGSNVSWMGNATFSENSATLTDGGALRVMNGSSAIFTASSYFLNNSAKRAGGALHVHFDSIAVWTAASYFFANTASLGGALSSSLSSTATWSAESLFYANSAAIAGGSIFLVVSCTFSLSAESFFAANSAPLGGAVFAYYSTVAWSAESFFYDNSASVHGGALYLSDSSSAAWTAASFVYANRANHYGGGVFLLDGSTVTWYADSFFEDNSAKYDGGAVSANNAALLWKNDNALFINNTARNGGAIFVRNGATAVWTGNTIFNFNSAKFDGGAVASRAFVRDERSLISIKGATSFVNNTCGAKGGGMAVVLSLAVYFESNDIIFFQNSAGISGGAVFDASIGIGTVYRNIAFLGNVAQNGGGIHVVGSGTTVTVDEKNEQVANPSTFDGCKFVENFAFGIGGAIDSASGQDLFNRTLFRGNEARVGGALRLAGKALVVDCSFIENISNLGEGPAISNVGYMYNVTNSYFQDNVFNCEIETFLDYKTGGFFETVCDGCPEPCVGCSFVEAHVRPTCTSLLEAGIEHATSDGGTTKVEELFIYEGYWRATKTSTNVNTCFYTKACRGGITDAPDYCLSGYEGRYCAVCSKNYVSSRNFMCRECPDRTTSISIAAVVSVLAAAVGLSLFLYLVSRERERAGRGIIDRVAQRIPKQSVKIIIVVWQILTQFTTMANVTYPNVYQTLLNGVDILNLDLSWIMSAGCFLEFDFHDRLLWITIAPPVIMCLLAATYVVAMYKNRGSPEAALVNVRQKHRSMMLLVAFLFYSSVSSVVFQAFSCEILDDGERYLRADYTIECDSTRHRAFQIYAGLMILVYPLGIPVCYALLLFSSRHVLRDEKHREESLVVQSSSDLWKPYKPERFYYEVIECGRRILLAGVVVFFYPNSAAQIAVALAFAFVFIFVSETMAPYQSQWDAWISRLGHAIVFLSMYMALLLKVDVSGEYDPSQKTFEWILVAAHGCMILAVVMEAVIMAFMLTTTKPEEDPTPVRRISL